VAARAVEVLAAVKPPSRGPEDRPGATPWRTPPTKHRFSDKRIESWGQRGFTTVVSAPKGASFPGQAAVLDLGGERNGDLVVKSPVALRFISIQPAASAAAFPIPKWAFSATCTRFGWTWTGARRPKHLRKNPRGTARPRYDRVNSALRMRLEDHPIVLIPANSSLELPPRFVLTDRWKFPESKISAAIVGAQMAYEIPDELAAKKLPVIVSLKWPEPEKDADPDRVQVWRELRFAIAHRRPPRPLAKAA